jgi:hypothetical protein
MSEGPLSQRGLWGLFREGLALYRQNLWPFLVLSAVYGTALTAANVVGLLFPTTITATFALLIAARAAGQPLSLGQAWRAVLRRLGPLVGSFLLYLLPSLLLGLAVALFFASAAAGAGLGLLLAYLVGLPALAVALWLGVLWALAPQAVMLEGCGPAASLAASARWVRGSWWRVFWLHVLLLGVYLIVFLAASFVIERAILNPLLGPLSPAGQALSGDLLLRLALALLLDLPVAILVTPFYPVMTTLLYLDLRARKAGYTREALRQELAKALGGR